MEPEHQVLYIERPVNVKRLSFCLILLMAGCVSSQNESLHSNGNGNGVQPPTIPVPKVHRHVTPLMSPKAAAEAEASAHRVIMRDAPTPVVPRWAFVKMPTNTFGNWQIEATSNLASGVWFPVAVVYGATNVVLTSDTVAKRGSLFYRVKQVK